MILAALDLARFRNYRKLSWRPGNQVNLLIGQNAQGKTNVLESIALLMRGRSKRIRTRTDIVTHGERDCRLAGRFEDSNALAHEVTLSIDSSGDRRFSLDGQKLERTSLLYEKLPCVFQESTDLEMLSGPPAGRRSFLDMFCLELSARYVTLYAKLEKLLKSRNALLARRRTGQELDILTKQFSAAAADVVMARLDAMRTLTEAIATMPPQEEEELSVRYEVYGGPRPEALETAQALSAWYLERLPEKLQEDLRMKSTGLGPQRDDLKLVLGKKPVKGIASRGQLKDVLLRLKVAETLAIRLRREEMPVLLLDDAFSETDETRRRQMIRWLPREAQIFLAGTDPTIASEFEEERCREFRVRKGTIDDAASSP